MRPKWPAPLGLATFAAVGTGLAVSIIGPGESRDTSADFNTQPTTSAGWEFMDAYSGCTVNAPHLESVQKGTARIAMNLTITPNPAIAAATEAGKVRYATAPRVENTETHEKLNNISVVRSLTAGENNEAILSVPVQALGMTGEKRYDIFAVAYNAEPTDAVKYYCGTVAVRGTEREVTVVQPGSPDPNMPQRQLFDPEG